MPDRKDGACVPSFQDGFMLKFGHSRHRALGDFKRTWRDDKTTCGGFWRSVKNYRTFRSVSMSTLAKFNWKTLRGCIKGAADFLFSHLQTQQRQFSGYSTPNT
ncbi:hypothetical protein ANA_C11656 [Anabaena sp. 90]|nr:hypothetical protein ANA_C11656 [Anabaena sp. 90]